MGSRPSTTAGFTLLELLLVLVLLVLFASMAALNFLPLERSARLDEGVGQLESLLRFARAEAAQQGRRVQLQAAPTSSTPDRTATAGRTLQVSWEPQPLRAPGVFVENPSTATLARSLNDLVRILDIRRVEPLAATSLVDTARAIAGGNGYGPGAGGLAAAPGDLDAEEWPPIMFYPDGSSDSAEILVAPAELLDARRMLVRWNGLSGTSTRQAATVDSETEPSGATAAAQPLEPASVARSALRQGAP